MIISFTTTRSRSLIAIQLLVGLILPHYVVRSFGLANLAYSRSSSMNTKSSSFLHSRSCRIYGDNIYSTTRLQMSDTTDADDSTTSSSASTTPMESMLSSVTDGEWEIIMNIISQAQEQATQDQDQLQEDDDTYEESKLEALVAEALPRFDPRLVMTMKKVAAADNLDDNNLDDDKMNAMVEVSNMLEYIMNQRLESGRDLLKSFLDAGEIRKLDSLIGKAQNEKRLDMAFFTVLNMNIKDAFEEAQSEGSDDSSVSMGGVPMTEFTSQENTPEQGSGANRLQILQHIYTRCQEEVEKAVQPGVGLLNKLLRTEMPPIRKNQLQHYLSPQSSLTLPDGKVIPLQTSGKALVPPMELVSAMTSAVDQIRQVEDAGGTDRKTAADLIESIRQLAIEARLVVIESYGEESEDLKTFQNGLQLVFRPGQKIIASDVE